MSGTVDTLGSGNDSYSAGKHWLDNTIYGAAGNDRLDGQSANDYLDGGAGNDTLLGGSQSDSLFGGSGQDSLVAGTDGDYLDGGEDGDTLIGSSRADLLIGGSGDDSILGGGGDDSFSGGDGSDTLVNTSWGSVTMNGGEGNDLLLAGGGKDIFLYGGSGEDTFSDLGHGGSNYYVSGGSGSSTVVIPETYDPSRLSTEGGTYQGQHYQAVYTMGNGSKIYFADCTGPAEFANRTVALAVVCFAKGTLIMTPEGERAVETLRAGDLVVTASGRGSPFKPVRWVGHRTVDLEAHPDPRKVAPILVRPGALGHGVPHRPLCVSPEHALLVEGALIPAERLVDGEMILRLPAKGEVTYLHVELEEHDIIVAEGALTESYIDLGNRGAFDNGGVVQMLHPDFAPRQEGGMPRVTEGPAFERALAVLAALREASRAEAGRAVA